MRVKLTRSSVIGPLNIGEGDPAVELRLEPIQRQAHQLEPAQRAALEEYLVEGLGARAGPDQLPGESVGRRRGVAEAEPTGVHRHGGKERARGGCRERPAESANRLVSQPAGGLGRCVHQGQRADRVLRGVVVDEDLGNAQGIHEWGEVAQLVAGAGVHHDDRVAVAPVLGGGIEPFDAVIGIEEVVARRQHAGDGHPDALALGFEGLRKGAHRAEAVAIGPNVRGEQQILAGTDELDERLPLNRHDQRFLAGQRFKL